MNPRNFVFASAIAFSCLTLPAFSAPKKAKEDPALKAAQAELARLQSARDSLSNLRWRLRQAQLDTRESYQVELDRVRDSLEAAATERSRLLEDVSQALSRPAEVKSGPDPFVKKTEQLRQEMIDRAQLLTDRVKYGLPWDSESRFGAITKVIRGLESYPGAVDGLEPLFEAYRAEWDFSRQIEKEEGVIPLASGAVTMGTRVRIASIGAWYLTKDNAAGILARSGTGEAPYVWHENLLAPTQRSILTGIGSREMDLPVDPMQAQADGPGYFKQEEKSLMSRLFDFKNGPLSQIPLLIARGILALLIFLGVGCVVVYLRRRSFVRREAADADTMRQKLFQALTKRESADAVVSKADMHTVAGRIVHLGFANRELSPESLEQLMASQESVEERRLGRGLNYLGNVASNAAFIGLLGTVLGILDAFAHLGGGNADAQVQVMAAIAEALIATALGLGVAIPAVIFYNNLTHSVRVVMEEARELRHLILAAGLDTVARMEQQVESPTQAKQEVERRESVGANPYGG
ncbi:MAG: MotA/TolQ/ExbB proton channel family protein [Fibrobacterota bacterium]|nr:MotA/TolQ/ExbB proton channel family protein [Fibrobacterota bacterium]